MTVMIPVPTTEQTGLSRMLDPIDLNRAIRRAFGGLESGPSLMIFTLAGLFTLATGAIWWRYDLMSTWNFTQGIHADVSLQAAAIAAKAGEITSDAGVASAIGSLLALTITLLPSIFELIAPRIVHPLAQLALNISILFDLITDWDQASVIQRALWAEPWLGIVGRTVVTFLIAMVVSVGVQILFILGLTATLVSAWNIITFGRGGSGQNGGYTVIQGR